jgi:hypothetical protein
MHDIEYGAEPVFEPGAVLDALALGKALNWYNNVCEAKQSKKFTIEFLKERKTGVNIIQMVNDLPEWRFTTVGWVSRIRSRNPTIKFPDISEVSVKQRYVDLIALAKKQAANKAPVSAKVDAPKLSPQDHLRAKFQNLTADLDDKIDAFFSNTLDANFKAEAWILNKDIKAKMAEDIVALYKEQREELQCAIDGEDEQVTEAYKWYTKKQLRKAVDFLNTIIDAAAKLASAKKAAKTPRKRKAQTPEKIVAKLKYAASAEVGALNLNSVPATTLINALQIWVYNTKKRKLTVYNADDQSGLSIKRSSIINFNAKTSVTKRLRKPEETLKVVVDGGKVVLRSLMDGIRTTPAPANGRINADTVLIRVVK